MCLHIQTRLVLDKTLSGLIPPFLTSLTILIPCTGSPSLTLFSQVIKNRITVAATYIVSMQHLNLNTQLLKSLRFNGIYFQSVKICYYQSYFRRLDPQELPNIFPTLVTYLPLIHLSIILRLQAVMEKVLSYWSSVLLLFTSLFTIYLTSASLSPTSLPNGNCIILFLDQVTDALFNITDVYLPCVFIPR